MLSRLVFALVTLLPQTPSSPQAAPPTCERVAVLGASVSAGFGLMGEVGSPVTLASFLRLALGSQSKEVKGFGDTMLFQDPLKLGPQQIDKAVVSDPTLVIAIDFAFWYGYGFLPSCKGRLELLQRCLDQLERISCPLLLGDFPDMTPALLGKSALLGGKPMLAPQQIPDAACMRKLNEHLRQWAAKRPNVHVFPLSTFVAEVAREGTFEFRGIRYDTQQKSGMLQSDLLHPTIRGTVAATWYILHILAEKGWLDAQSVSWDPRKLEQEIFASTQGARDKAEQKRRKREQRKADRKAKKKAQQDPKQGADLFCPLPQ